MPGYHGHLCAAAFIVLGITSPARAAPEPNLAATDFAWLATGADWIAPPPGMGHGPIKSDPEHPFRSNAQGGQPTPRIADTSDPVLKPWAAAQMTASNDEVLTGKLDVPFVAQARCWPGGVPAQLLASPPDPFYFVQTKTEVWMMWQMDQMVRRIYLTDRHAKTVKPSWFGESIGHYENGNTLVVDTIGLSTKNSFIDKFRTPHTEKEHVVERYTLSADGTTLQATVTVDDPDTFNESLHLIQRWHKVATAQLSESACAENNNNYFHQKLFPMPEAGQPDF